MSCTETRRALDHGRPAVQLEHLAGCRACSVYAERLELARRALREHRAEVEPDPAFAARVAARIDRPLELVGSAALRILPAAVALALILGALVQLTGSEPQPGGAAGGAESVMDEVLVWLAEPAGDAG
ncbi:MAG TPA: hypothetical protein VGB99_09135 [Acidobacteriota bacterium]